MHYDFDDFINSIKYLDKKDILETAYKKHKLLDKVLVREKKEGGTALQDKIRGLLFWIEKQQRPEGLSDENFAKLRPICESLISKKEMEPQAIKLFGK